MGTYTLLEEEGGGGKMWQIIKAGIGARLWKILASEQAVPCFEGLLINKKNYLCVLRHMVKTGHRYHCVLYPSLGGALVAPSS